ncbi:MAG: GNAT family N-acetyltransferase [Acholeplasmatales bacterium]|nr:GNAT family N-acetyltransferase [Acholeplasmatales bacterium]
MELKRLDINYIDEIIELRLKQLKDEGSVESFDLKPNLFKFYTEQLISDNFAIFGFIDNNRIIATGSLSIMYKPPYYNCPNGKIGLLSSMYVDPSYRRQGLATKMLDKIVEYAKENDCSLIHITASKMGELLYTKYGFIKKNNFMEYKI